MPQAPPRRNTDNRGCKHQDLESNTIYNMATNRASTANGNHATPEKSYYEQQREMLITEIAQVRLT